MNELIELISQGENLTVEFKSDVKPLSDRDLVATVMNLSNTEGGDFLLGVEDDGSITGLHINHHNMLGIVALVANKTNPPVTVQVMDYLIEDKKIAHIKVPKSKQLISTSEGLLQRRRLMPNGKPEAVPFYPHEFIQRLSSVNLFDTSEMPILDLTVKDLNPIERVRIREAIKTYRGDASLLSLSDEELDGALGLVVEVDGILRPTFAGLLLLGYEPFIRRYAPSHEVAFQVLKRTDVIMNEFFRKPLLQTFEMVENLFSARINEQELEFGLFRVPVPNYDKRAFREALVNALVHRDYARLGAIHVQIDENGLSISNPGGFVEGINLNNILVTNPKPRNPLLADICKRIGLSERTGRGIDRIFEGLLRFGRPHPDYSYSNSSGVVVKMSGAEGDLPFLEMVIKEEKRSGASLSLDSMIILSRLKDERRLGVEDLIISTQKPEQETRKALEGLVESGLLEAHGTGRDRTYTLSVNIYQKAGQKAGYIRQTGFSVIQQEQMIISYMREHKTINRTEVADLCRISPFQAKRLLRKMVNEYKISLNGKGRGTYYQLIFND